MRNFSLISILVSVLGYTIGTIFLHSLAGTWAIITMLVIVALMFLSQICGFIFGMIAMMTAVARPEKSSLWISIVSMILPFIFSWLLIRKL